MLNLLARNWWLLALRGLLALIFGLLALIWPAITLRVLVILFGAYALVDGLFRVITALKDSRKRWGILLLEGVLGIALGILAFIWPDITALALLYLIAAWALVTGILEIMAAVWLRKELKGEWLLGLAGLASVVFGLLLVIWPGSGVLAIVWLIGAYAIVFGVLLIALAFRLRSWGKSLERKGV
jgi:uncharacterized membrane protein HdeD (DUF308 family)